MTKLSESRLRAFERKILRRILGPVCEGGCWRRRRNDEVYQLYSDIDVVKFAKLGRLRWAGHVWRLQEDDPAKKLLATKPYGTRGRGRPRQRWIDDVEEDTARAGCRDWRMITGAAKSTPIMAMELQTDIEPQKYRRETAALALSERLKRNGVQHWRDYTPASAPLRTQGTFLSKAAIVALGSSARTQSRDVVLGRKAIEELQAGGTTIALQWIPSHCGIWGNERADALAREGSQMEMPNSPFAYQAAKGCIKSCVKERIVESQTQTATGKRWSTLLEPKDRVPPNLSRMEAVAGFRHITGHDYLNAHLHRIRVKDHPGRTLCQSPTPMTTDHLFDCPHLDGIRNSFLLDDTHWVKIAKLYWAARGHMAEEPQT
ncbi:hypothetical protein GE061_008359 [Apolygus lucorum]|uniref:RNase H type-1 domain-containing protein n=1 Tax=Apolygus lucorum TaxID=248454 RepID=A0A8S9WPM9_APOLU|nr:hypothetical protein GE061_008359 [Apolygus lucorum]